MLFNPFIKCHFLFLIPSLPVVVIRAIAIPIDKSVINMDIVSSIVHIAFPVTEFFNKATVSSNPMPSTTGNAPHRLCNEFPRNKSIPHTLELLA